VPVQALQGKARTLLGHGQLAGAAGRIHRDCGVRPVKMGRPATQQCLLDLRNNLL
jgi:hypothetical protein